MAKLAAHRVASLYWGRDMNEGTHDLCGFRFSRVIGEVVYNGPTWSGTVGFMTELTWQTVGCESCDRYIRGADGKLVIDGRK